MALTVISAMTLAVGLPLLALTSPERTETVTGRVIQIEPAAHLLVVQQPSAQLTGAGRQITVHLTGGQQVTRTGGTEPLTSVAVGEQVRARVSIRSDHDAVWVAVDEP